MSKNSDGAPGGFRRATRCFEDQANACGIVLDVGFICLLTRCRPGLAGTVATGGSYRRGRRSVLAIPPTGAPDSLSRAPSSPSSRVHVPGTFTVRGCPGVTDGLDGELARLQDRGYRGMAPSCKVTRQHWIYGVEWVRAITGFDASLAVAVAVRGELLSAP